ncbi:MAG: DUF4375 domain-containing protein [Actinobacteria bacterium]|nr:DUF4375 domain-containing protein [Actinomycetota bacterium]
MGNLGGLAAAVARNCRTARLDALRSPPGPGNLRYVSWFRRRREVDGPVPERTAAPTDPAGVGYRLYDAIALVSFTSLNASQRRLVALGDLHMEVNNGGFHQYFFNSAGDHVEHALAAAIETDAAELVDLIQRARATMPGVDSPDRARRQRILARWDDEAFARLEPLDNEYYRIERDFSSDMDNLVWAHKDDFFSP